MFEWIFNPEAWLALVTLTALEIVLGIDNIIFISIVVGRLPPQKRDRARLQGLALAMLTRILLLLFLTWMMRLTSPLFTLLEHEISGRDLILIGGGLFLLWKSAQEIWENLEGTEEKEDRFNAASSYLMVLGQIAVIDIVFSLDSVITAVGMARDLPVMVIAIVVAVAIMMLAAKSIGDFVDNHPSIKMLALSFLILVGVALIGEGLEMHIPKGYIYFAMAFSVAVEMLNIHMRKKQRRAVQLHKPISGRKAQTYDESRA
jgi:predicted tellurium resistance membrane protein TerC